MNKECHDGVSTGGSYANPAWITSLAWSKITSAPTTISGYGITDGVSTGGSYANPVWITSLAWSKISSTPTTIAGYGITDAIVNSWAKSDGYGIISTLTGTGSLTYTPRVDTTKLVTITALIDTTNAHAATPGWGILYTTGTNTFSADSASSTGVASKPYLQAYAYTKKNQVDNGTNARTLTIAGLNSTTSPFFTGQNNPVA